LRWDYISAAPLDVIRTAIADTAALIDASRFAESRVALRSSTITAIIQRKWRNACAAQEVAGKGRVLVAFQPHRYSRTVLLMDEFSRAFADADQLWITDNLRGRRSAN